MDPEFIRELFAPFGAVTLRRMFGGAGIWSDGFMFALVFDGAIFLKVDAASIPDFEREGSRPFVYTRAKSPGRVGRASLSYWRQRRSCSRSAMAQDHGRCARQKSSAEQWSARHR